MQEVLKAIQGYWTIYIRNLPKSIKIISVLTITWIILFTVIRVIAIKQLMIYSIGILFYDISIALIIGIVIYFLSVHKEKIIGEINLADILCSELLGLNQIFLHALSCYYKAVNNEAKEIKFELAKDFDRHTIAHLKELIMQDRKLLIALQLNINTFENLFNSSVDLLKNICPKTSPYYSQILIIYKNIVYLNMFRGKDKNKISVYETLLVIDNIIEIFYLIDRCYNSVKKNSITFLKFDIANENWGAFLRKYPQAATKYPF